MTSPVTEDLADLVACVQCDALHHRPRARSRCRRCHAWLSRSRPGAHAEVVALALAALILMVGAVIFPFLTVEAGGLANTSSLIDTVRAFDEGLFLPLALICAAMIIALPALRLAAILYTVAPLMLGLAPFAGARAAFRLADRLKPWAMAEIFILGTAVALVKVAGLAKVQPGPAFWALSALVLLVLIKDGLLCRQTVWAELERS